MKLKSYLFVLLCSLLSFLVVTFAHADGPYIVKVKANKRGIISHVGEITVPAGESQVITIAPMVGYHTASVIVDGVDKGAVTRVNIPGDLNLSAKKHSIKAKFNINFYEVTATALFDGKVSLATNFVKHGKTAKIAITPYSGYRIEKVFVNGESQAGFPLETYKHKLAVPITSETHIDVLFAPGATQGTGVVPMQSSNSSNFTEIEAGNEWILAIDYNKHLWAWGDNSHGQLGDETTTAHGPKPLPNFMRPGAITPVTDFVAISAGTSHALAVDTNGYVWGWGSNQRGQFIEENSYFHNDTADRLTPAVVEGLPPIVAVSAATSHSLALDRHGQVWGWGFNNFSGLLGIDPTDNSEEHYKAPMLIPGFPQGTEIVAISASDTHNMALDAHGNVWTWGSNGRGELGNGTTSTFGRYFPEIVTGLPFIQSIDASSGYSLALASSTTGDASDRSYVWMWGNNSSGVLGVSTSGDVVSPARVEGFILPPPSSGVPTSNYYDEQGMAKIEAGYGSAMAIDHGGRVWTWGSDLYRMDPNRSGVAPVIVKEIGSSPKDIEATVSASFVLNSTGVAYAWGFNQDYRLLADEAVFTLSPVEIFIP